MIGVWGEVQVEVFVQVLKVTVMHVKSQETGAWLCSIRLACVCVWVDCLSVGGEFVLQWMEWDAGMGRGFKGGVSMYSTVTVVSVSWTRGLRAVK